MAEIGEWVQVADNAPPLYSYVHRDLVGRLVQSLGPQERNLLWFLLAAVDYRMKRWESLGPVGHEVARCDGFGRVFGGFEIPSGLYRAEMSELSHKFLELGIAIVERVGIIDHPEGVALIADEGVLAVKLSDGATLLSEAYWVKMMTLRVSVSKWLRGYSLDNPSVSRSETDGGIYMVDMSTDQRFATVPSSPASLATPPIPHSRVFKKGEWAQHELIKLVDDAWRRKLCKMRNYWIDNFTSRADWLTLDQYAALQYLKSGVEMVLQNKPEAKTPGWLKAAYKSAILVVIAGLRAMDGCLSDVRAVFPTVDDLVEERCFEVANMTVGEYEERIGLMSPHQMHEALLEIDWDGLKRLSWAERREPVLGRQYPISREEVITRAGMGTVRDFIGSIPKRDLAGKYANATKVERMHLAASQCGYPVLSHNEVGEVRDLIRERCLDVLSGVHDF